MSATQPLAGLLQLVRADQAFLAILEASKIARTVDVVGPSVVYPLVAAQIVQSQSVRPESPGVTLILTTTGRAADELATELSAYIPADGIAVFPSWETLPHERLSPSADTVGKRMAVYAGLHIRSRATRTLHRSLS